MFSFKKTLLGLLVLMISQSVVPSSAARSLSPETPAEAVSLQQGQELLFELQADPGDYIQLGWSASSGSFHLDSVERTTGKHIRRFISENVGRAPFLLVAGEQPMDLKVSAVQTGQFTLSVLREVASSEHVSSQEEYLSPRIAKLAEHLKTGGTSDDFWSEVVATGTPLVEDQGNGNSILTFLAKDAKNAVRLLGAPTSNHEELDRLGISDVWFKSFVLPNTTRLSYQLAKDVPQITGSWMERRRAILATLSADPFNKYPWPSDAIDPYNQHSTVLLPKAEKGRFLQDRGGAKGSLTKHVIESRILENKRNIWIYRSVGYEVSKETAPLLLMFDAEHYNGRISVPTILDNMVAEGVIPPLAAVFISHIDGKARSNELPNNASFAQFMAKTLLPFVEEKLGAFSSPDRTILAGSSYGGLASSTVALRYPRQFGNVLSMSGSYWYSEEGDENYVAKLIASKPKQDLSFFLSAGLFEKGVGGRDRGILYSNQHLRDVLIAKGYPVQMRIYAAGHDLFSWQTILSDGLIHLLGNAARK
ncbi:Putative esterase [Pseudovibrio sp. FO-BEG1]|uniref:alpha/beta hydrolase-fold protein n=1 Tax=Pseudovibrio sp. (strain FO-BEG1) TaxID=911045 RepID=UPI000238D52E|nr:alpha/beta hydrolase-fold protein [Pseudovibrio sp. FO-BEG1]AEV37604.1 Putative esterase [Pseudovibrio sp. FO-BEG1]